MVSFQPAHRLHLRYVYFLKLAIFTSVQHLYIVLLIILQALYLVKSCVIAATMATVRGWKRLGKAILKHNVPAVCQCGYKTRLDSLLRCAGLPGCDQIDDISDEPDIYVRYAGDEALWASVQDAQTVGQAFDRGQETLRRRAAEQTVPTQEQTVPTQEQIPTQLHPTQVSFFFKYTTCAFLKKKNNA